MSKSLLIVSRHAPWSGLAAREALDIALAGGAFDLPIGMLFLDDGVLQLRANQQPTTLAQKDLQANLKALPIFGVDSLYACAKSLAARGITSEQLAVPVTVLDLPELRQLYNSFDQVVTC